MRSSEKDDPAGPVPFDNKLLAFHALKIGLKHSYDNWRMWMNYMIVAMDVGEFSEAARAQARVVEERPEVFKKTLQVQMKQLVLDPLREVGMQDHPKHFTTYNN